MLKEMNSFILQLAELFVSGCKMGHWNKSWPAGEIEFVKFRLKLIITHDDQVNPLMLIFTDDQVNPQYHGFPDFNYNTLFLRDHDIMCLSTYHQLLCRCKTIKSLAKDVVRS